MELVGRAVSSRSGDVEGWERKAVPAACAEGGGMLMRFPRCIHYSFFLPHMSFSSKAITEKYHVIHASVRSG